MQWRSAVGVWGASRQSRSKLVGMLAIAALAASAGGCSLTSSSSGRASLASAPSPGSTVTFESIDGPPPDVFRKLVTSLNDEAGTRQIAVVPRSGAATYRVRGYVSALVDRDKTTFAWVWDVYDTDKRRALRITGEEAAPAGRRRDAWAAADEQLLRRMARSGMERIAAFLSTPEPAPVIAPEPSLVTLVSGRDDTPEAAGIFRVFGSQDRPVGQPATDPAVEALPPQQPKTGKRQPSAAKQAAALSTAQ